MFWSADKGREVAFGQVLASVACANGATTIVDYYRCIVEVGHVECVAAGVRQRRARRNTGSYVSGEVLLIDGRSERGKAPPKYIARAKRSLYFVFTLPELPSRENRM